MVDAASSAMFKNQRWHTSSMALTLLMGRSRLLTGRVEVIKSLRDLIQLRAQLFQPIERPLLEMPHTRMQIIDIPMCDSLYRMLRRRQKLVHLPPPFDG